MTYRKIDPALVKPGSMSQQAAPQLIWADIADLVIDDRYQRPLVRNSIDAIQRIVANFRWSRFSPVLVAPIEGGKYAIIDGQHRAHAAAACGVKSIPAMVVLVPPDEQALAFVEINSQQIRVAGHSVYRAALMAGEPWAVQARDCVASAGCALMQSNGNTKTKKPGQIYAIGLVRKMVSAGQSDAITTGLAAMIAADPESVANFDGALLTPWLSAVAMRPEFSSADLVTVLKKSRPWQVIEAATRYAKSEHLPISTCRRDAFVALIRAEMRA